MGVLQVVHRRQPLLASRPHQQESCLQPGVSHGAVILLQDPSVLSCTVRNTVSPFLRHSASRPLKGSLSPQKGASLARTQSRDKHRTQCKRRRPEPSLSPASLDGKTPRFVRGAACRLGFTCQAKLSPEEMGRRPHHAVLHDTQFLPALDVGSEAYQAVQDHRRCTTTTSSSSSSLQPPGSRSKKACDMAS